MIFERKAYQIGEEKHVVKFALLPKKIDEYTTVWFGRYVQVYQYMPKPFVGGDVKFRKKERYIASADKLKDVRSGKFNNMRGDRR